jgi:hypothetical protein
VHVFDDCLQGPRGNRGCWLAWRSRAWVRRCRRCSGSATPMATPS